MRRRLYNEHMCETFEAQIISDKVHSFMDIILQEYGDEVDLGDLRGVIQSQVSMEIGYAIIESRLKAHQARKENG